jgi:phosphoglucomutase
MKLIVFLNFLFYFRFTFDAMHAVAGAYATPIFVDKLGASPVWFSSVNSCREWMQIYMMLIFKVM